MKTFAVDFGELPMNVRHGIRDRLPANAMVSAMDVVLDGAKADAQDLLQSLRPSSSPSVPIRNSALRLAARGDASVRSTDQQTPGIYLDVYGTESHNGDWKIIDGQATQVTHARAVRIHSTSLGIETPVGTDLDAARRAVADLGVDVLLSAIAEVAPERYY